MGRPRKTEATEEAKAPEVKAAQTSKPKTVKRNLPDESTAPVFYETLKNKGGIFFKLRSKNVTIFDKEEDRVRQIRYCPGEDSPYVDEQSEYANIEHVIFNNKMLHVPYDKPNLRKFLDLHPDNQANGGTVFKKLNKEVDSELELEKEFQVVDAINLVKVRPIEELLPVAMALNINTNQKDISIKRALVQQARQNPTRFMALVDSPMVMARSTVMQAFDFQIIEERNGAVVWFDTGKLIISVPVGQDKSEVMTRFVMTDKGSSVLSELERQLGEIA